MSAKTGAATASESAAAPANLLKRLVMGLCVVVDLGLVPGRSTGHDHELRCEKQVACQLLHFCDFPEPPAAQLAKTYTSEPRLCLFNTRQNHSM
jgi:hypothetical protein